MTKLMKNETRKAEIRKRFKIYRISSEVGQNMTQAEKDKIHITPSIKD